MSSKHLKGMNKQQRKAVRFGINGKSLPPPLLIIAGAGTGKTAVLVHRVAQAILYGEHPKHIALLTFTRRAATEMIGRVQAICRAISKIAADFPWAGTFHAVAAKLLRQYGSAIGIRPSFQILDRADAEDLMDVLIHDLRLTSANSGFPQKAACVAIHSRMINCSKSLQAVLRLEYPNYVKCKKKLQKLFAAYEAEKRKQNVLDYDDLLVGWVKLLLNKRVGSEIKKLFRYVFVDEYQDTNHLQAQILLLLKPDGRGLTVVGDDAQAIYSFRGATVQNILRFAKKFSPRAKIIKLEQNYRSTQPILNACNSVMALSRQGYAKQLFSTRKSKLKPSLVVVEDSLAQARYVAGNILKAGDAGVPLKEQAILFRASSHSAELELELGRRNIPFVKYGGLRFVEASHIKDVVSMLRWAENPQNRVAATRVLKRLPGIGSATADRLFGELSGPNFVRKLRTVSVPPAAKSDWRSFRRTVAQIHQARKWPDDLGAVLRWYKPRLKQIFPKDSDLAGRELDLRQLQDIAAHRQSRQAFMTDLTLDPPDGSLGKAEQAKKENGDHIVLSTIHSAKGQEYSHVSILNAIEGCIPSSNAGDSPEEIEEERRVFHVAMTRAKNDLSILVPRQHFSARSSVASGDCLWARQTQFLPKSTWRYFARCRVASRR
jgi:DNA helicase II / ATP-dependent DNA helicase PcrA